MLTHERGGAEESRFLSVGDQRDDRLAARRAEGAAGDPERAAAAFRRKGAGEVETVIVEGGDATPC